MINHVVSLERSKKLVKYLPEGYESEQCYWRAKPSKNNEYWNQIAPKTLTKEELKERQSEWNKWAVNLKRNTHELRERNLYMWDYEIIPALLLTEVMELLPIEIEYPKHTGQMHFLMINHTDIRSIMYQEKMGKFQIGYVEINTDYNKIDAFTGMFTGHNLPTAAAELLIWVKERENE